MKNITAALLFVIINLSAAVSLTGQYKSESENFKKFQLIPVDDSSNDPEFRSFIEEFKKAVAVKNIKYIKKHISPQIIYSFENENTDAEAFFKAWKLNRSYRKSEFWNEMERVLATVPSSSEEDGNRYYVFPYVFEKFPGDQYDSYSYAAVTAKKVNLRKTPSVKGKVLASLDYEIVKIIEATHEKRKVRVGGKSGSWIKVQTSSGTRGYIFDYYLHSPIGYRAIFKKNTGTWLLTHFITGD
ncbi:MAG TPA: SH3 domain-containing protein [Spirochaetota bacterium]|nr:SH3 domain-containing protein [Spirochaetota bacterium]